MSYKVISHKICKISHMICINFPHDLQEKGVISHKSCKFPTKFARASFFAGYPCYLLISHGLRKFTTICRFSLAFEFIIFIFVL